MNIRPLESLTKEELIELVKHEQEHFADARNMVEPTLTPKQIAYRLVEYAAEYAAQLRKPAFGEEDPAHYELSNLIDRSRYRIMPGPDPLFLIEKAMRGEK